MRVHRIFASIAGEVNPCGQGVATTFIRLQGCNLSCSWCDTPQAQNPKKGYKIMSVDDVVATISNNSLLPKQVVTITGGEHLMQSKEVYALCRALVLGFNSTIVIETNGSIRANFFETNILWSIDWKAPSAGYTENRSFNRLNYRDLPYGSQIKCVVHTIEDLFDFLSWVDKMDKRFGTERAALSLNEPNLVISATSPDKLTSVYKSVQEMKPSNMYNIRKRRLWFNLQIHKILGLE